MSVDPRKYTKIPYVIYETLEEKLEALLNGEVLYLKGFERNSGEDVLIRLVRNKFTTTQMSYDMNETEAEPRYWVTYNVGFNDLSLFTVIKFEEGIHRYDHRFKINDIVQYKDSEDKWESGIIEEIYVTDDGSNLYAYKISGEDELFDEDDLVKNVYI